MIRAYIRQMRTASSGVQLILFFLLLTAAGCKKDYEGIEVLDERNIQEYMQKNGLKMQQYDTTGIYYQVIKTGSGDSLDYTLQLPIVYTVKTLDESYSSQDTIMNHYGNYFGYYSPADLRDIMKNIHLKQGGSLRVILPSRKAYGRNGNRSLGIPGNASLDFTITVLEKKNLLAYEGQMIRNYMSRNNLTGYIQSPDSIYYKIIETGGAGSPINLDSTLTLNYTGRFLNGTTFETAEGAQVILRSFIPAWQKMVPLIKEGGTIRFILPSNLAYGIVGSSDPNTGKAIPAFSPLDFEVKVTDVAL